MNYEERYRLIYEEAILRIFADRCGDCGAKGLPLTIYDVTNRYERLADSKALCSKCLASILEDDND